MTPQPTSPGEDLADLAQALIATRQNVLPKRLAEPGPDAVQLQRLLQAAAAAPDHGELRPWRFVIVPAARRGLLAQAFADALLDRDPGACAQDLDAARDKAYRAPLLMLAVARLGPAAPDIPAIERLVTVGAALQNFILLAHAMGYGAGLTSGQALGSRRMRELFRLQPGEEPVCFVSVGSITQRKPMRPRASPSEFTSEL